jgi:NADH-ubiquinone oxidoreductase chain 5
MGSDFLSQSLFIHPNHISIVEAHFSLPLFIKLLPAILTIFSASLALYLYNVIPNYLISLTGNSFGRNIYVFFNGKYFVDVIYNHYIINASLLLGYTISKVLDRGIIEIVGPHGISTSLFVGSNDIAKLDTGNITSYALYLMLALVGLTFILFSPKLMGNAMSDPRLVLLFTFTLLIAVRKSK